MEKIKTAKITWLEKQQETVKRNKFMQNDKKIILTRIQSTKMRNFFAKTILKLLTSTTV
jgi:hypothetical protein